MLLKIKTLTGKVLRLQVEPTDTVGKVKQMLVATEGHPVEVYRLIFNGINLEDNEATLCHYNIGNGSLLHLVLRMRGMISSFTSNDASDPLTRWLMMSDEERAAADEPLTELFMLSTKLNAYGTFELSTFDLFTEKHYAVMNQFLDVMFKDHAGQDMKLVVTEYQLANLLAVDHSADADDIVSNLQSNFKGSNPAKLAFRVTQSPTQACIAFHCDGAYESSTTQIALNSTKDYKGGKLVFFDARAQELHVLERPQGTMTHHVPRILHGVTNLTEGTRKSLFVLDRSNGLNDKEVVVVTNTQVDEFLSTYVEPMQTTNKEEREIKNDDVDLLIRELTPLNPENASRNAAEFMRRAKQAASKFRTRTELLECLHGMSDLVKCPLLLTRMCEPVKTPEGHSFSRNAITAWLSTNPSCPLTRKSLTVGDLVRDEDLERIINVAFPALPATSTKKNEKQTPLLEQLCHISDQLDAINQRIEQERERRARVFLAFVFATVSAAMHNNNNEGAEGDRHDKDDEQVAAVTRRRRRLVHQRQRAQRRTQQRTQHRTQQRR